MGASLSLHRSANLTYKTTVISERERTRVSASMLLFSHISYMRKYSVNISGCPFTVITDHKPLEPIFKNPSFPPTVCLFNHWFTLNDRCSNCKTITQSSIDQDKTIPMTIFLGIAHPKQPLNMKLQAKRRHVSISCSCMLFPKFSFGKM